MSKLDVAYSEYENIFDKKCYFIGLTVEGSNFKGNCEWCLRF